MRSELEYREGAGTMPEVFKNYINGKWVTAEKTFENRNPADRRDLIGLFPASGPDDVSAAVAAAKNSFRSWRLVPAPPAR